MDHHRLFSHSGYFSVGDNVQPTNLLLRVVALHLSEEFLQRIDEDHKILNEHVDIIDG